ncbi:hypothetical protein PAPYR_484 [Paratrimastix pyriformis]|uniref:Hemicentin-1-like von Willebrand factor A domain-containing protein n=1 Tax=Paratrimastix pyriformis TaxID=342808 RepID=A0ABQ8UXL6_9EUKA|nr:hypothetical protein PAPYR_484 [Paratrimastix pyriformis]
MEPRSPEVKARTGVSPAKRVTFAGAAMGSLIRGGHMNSGPCALGVSPGRLGCPGNWRGPSTEATRPTDADLLPLPRLAETGQGPPWPGKRLCARRMHGPADGNHRSRKDCGRAFGIERIRDGMKTDGVVEDHQSTFNVGEMFGEFASERLFLDEQLQQTGFDRAWSIGLAAAFAATAGKTRRPVRSDGPIGSPQSRSELCRRGRFWCRALGNNELVATCLLVDITGSMDASIENIKTGIAQACTAIADSANVRMKIAFVGYHDICDGSKRFVIHDFDEPANIAKLMETIKAAGGGDEAEDVIGGLEQVAALHWVGDVRQLIHITDCPAHGRQFHQPDITDDHPNGLPGQNPAQTLARLHALRIRYKMVLANLQQKPNLFASQLMMYKAFQLMFEREGDRDCILTKYQVEHHDMSDLMALFTLASMASIRSSLVGSGSCWEVGVSRWSGKGGAASGL